MRRLRTLSKIACSALFCFLAAQQGLAAAQELDASTRPRATVSVRELAVPRGAWEHLERAKRAARAQREDLFEREVQEAITLYPPFFEAYLLLADRENGAGRADAAIENALKAYALDAESVSGRIVLASAYNSKRRYAEALAILAGLHGSSVESWQAKYERARAEVGMGHAAEALLWGRRALEAAPTSCADAHVLMANAYQLNHQWEDASREMETYLALGQPLLHEQVVREVLVHTRQLAERDRVAAGDAASSASPAYPR